FKKPFDPELAKIEHTLNLVEVEFKSMRRDFFINEQNLELKPGDYVLVEALRGIDLGRVHLVGEKVHQKRNFLGIVGQLMRKVIRLANEEDLNKLKKNREDEVKAHYIFKQRVKAFNLEMKLIDVEYQFDRNRLTFYFTASGRVDFRAFVRDLAKIFKTRIELWQIGVRDEQER
ncbi:PSP1 C-terminal conserved region, partial [Candidatus Kryptonium thompsonii]